MVFLARSWYSLNYGIARFFPDSVHPLPALLLTLFFARSLTLVPRSLLLNRAETLATQATLGVALGIYLPHSSPTLSPNPFWSAAFVTCHVAYIKNSLAAAEAMATASV